jgi:hypothetical protein
MEVALAVWCPASKVDELGAWKGDEQPTNKHLRSRILPASAVERVKMNGEPFRYKISLASES